MPRPALEPRLPLPAARSGGALAVGLAATVLAMLAATACGPATPMVATDFWREAAADPVLVVDPPVELPLAGSSTVVELTAQVLEQTPGRLGDAEFSLDLRGADGRKVTLHYALGAGRSMPLQRGAPVRLALFLHRDRDGLLGRGLVVSALRPGAAPQVVAVLDELGAVPQDRLPPPLAIIEPTDSLAYQTAERVEGECYLAVAHQHLSIGADPLGRKPGRATRRLVAPGSRVRLWDDAAQFDVLMIDNRRTLTTTCAPEPPPLWAWSAIWVPEPVPTPATKETPGAAIVR